MLLRQVRRFGAFALAAVGHCSCCRGVGLAAGVVGDLAAQAASIFCLSPESAAFIRERLERARPTIVHELGLAVIPYGKAWGIRVLWFRVSKAVPGIGVVFDTSTFIVRRRGT